MDFSSTSTEKELRAVRSFKKKIGNKLILFIFKAVGVSAIMLFAWGVSMGLGMFNGIVDNTPKVSISSIAPMGYATTVYDSKGNLTDTLVMAGSNRQEITYEDLPQDLIDAFVAIEDARFWQHQGVDGKSVLRAIYGMLTKSSSTGGGSTITQQLIKNNVFNGGRESSIGATIERKFQEWFLALDLERNMDKKIILTNYLNTINLGNNCLGVQVAAKRYFNKDVSELTLSECTVIAGITQNPSKLNPISGAKRNAEKRKVILKYMKEQGYITEAEEAEALADDVYDRIQNVDMVSHESINTYSYFTDELIDQVMEVLTTELDYTETQAHNLLYSGGLTIYTTQDPDLQKIVDEEINDPANYPNTDYSLEYRLSVENKDGEVTNYNDKTLKTWYQDKGNTYTGLFRSPDAAYDLIESYKAAVIPEGATILGEKATITPQPETSFVLIEQSTGQVKALTGGRGTKTASLTFNRASDALRQPGSTFKVLSAFAPALDTCGSTLGTVYYDAPLTIGSKTFRNWYGAGYLGWSNIRDGIIYSMNIVAIKCFVDTVSPQLGVDYCRKFGITSLTETDYNPATALGGITDGVSNLELTSAYSAIANGGNYIKPMLFTRILDHDGKVLYEVQPERTRVIKESTAFLLTDAMADSMTYNHAYAREGVSVSSTSTAARLDSMSCAGKSGTTSNSYDIWFVGYTPYYTGGVWAGYDNYESTMSGQSSFHKVIWKKIMDRAHSGLADPGFDVPGNIVSRSICRKSGKLAIPDVCSADPRGSSVYTEYFEEGTQPTEMCDHHTTIQVCALTHMLPLETCEETVPMVTMIVPDSADETDDTLFATLLPCNEAELELAPGETLPSEGTINLGPGYQSSDSQHGPSMDSQHSPSSDSQRPPSGDSQHAPSSEIIDSFGPGENGRSPQDGPLRPGQ